ncbi:unnamed protein product [Adineta ricciae]|uniref:DUF4515 domain-containing protein n=1 Tax=Adineta ricciae TaxID=249248 RepID=A0A814CLY3_ADIRI|nr:unnamed protein product [Adineta ricciae]CAF1149359.1 unnamed protein product [Adineta ricciae]
MPPKGKKGKKGKSDKKKKDAPEKEEKLRPSDKELVLQEELDKKVQKLAEIKLRVRTAQEENHWLNEEASKVRAETAEYVQYMAKKTNTRQTQVITLTDYHHEQIRNINRDKENMLKDYEKKKEELRAQLMKKEQILAQTNRELEAIGEYRNIQEQQNNEIKRLQEEINQIRGKHVREIAQMRTTFERALHDQRMDEGARVQAIRRQADEEAEQFLYDRSVAIQNENLQLRKSLQDFLKRIRALNESKQRLEEEQIHLIRQLKLATDLQRIRLNKAPSAITASAKKST